MTRIAILALLLLLPAGASAGKGQGAFWRSLLVPGWGQRYATGGGGWFFFFEKGRPSESCSFLVQKRPFRTIFGL